MLYLKELFISQVYKNLYNYYYSQEYIIKLSINFDIKMVSLLTHSLHSNLIDI